MTPLKKKSYKHVITEELFLEALTASDEEFAKKRNYYQKNGIVRTNGGELRKEMPFLFWYGVSNERVTFIYDAEIKRNIKKDSLLLSHINNTEMNSLLLYNCYSDTIFFNNCTLAKREEIRLVGFNLYLIGTIIEGLVIKDSFLANINSREFKTNNLAFDNSNFWNFKIDKSHINTFAFNQYIIYDIRIGYECEIGRLSIKDTKLNGLYVRNTKATDISIFLRSKIKALYIQTSQVEKFEVCNQSSTNKISVGFNANIGNAYLSDDINLDSFSVNDSVIESLELRRNITITSISCRNTTLNYFKCNDLSCAFYFGNVKGVEAKIINSKCDSLSIKDCKTNFYIEDGTINCLNLSKSSLPQENAISISNQRIFSVLMNEFSVFGKLFFIKVAALEKPINEKKQEKDDCSPTENSTFKIVYSSLGETEFINSDLNSFDSFEFSNSRITQAFVTGGFLPESNIQIFESKTESYEWYDQMVSLFNQFSSIFQSQGHIYQSVDYRSKSNYYQHELLKAKKDNVKNWSDRLINWFDRFPFFWNKWSSNYGASWARALGFTFITSLLCYLIILFCSGNLFQTDMHFDKKFIGYYFDFLNPLRPFDFYSIYNIDVTWFGRLIDLLSRVVIGYGIYQLIAAFRRYGRK